jgi:hypothetical protein
MNWKSTAASGLGLIAMSWWGVVSQPAAPMPVAVRATPAGEVSPAANSDIEHEAARLQARLHPDEPYTAPSRNPFRFGAAAAPAPHRPALPPTAVTAFDPAAVPLPPSLPPLSLAGIATDVVDGLPQRTAILSTPSGVQLVKEGDPVAPDYRVGKIEDEAIDLIAADGQTRRLALGRP